MILKLMTLERMCDRSMSSVFDYRFVFASELRPTRIVNGSLIICENEKADCL